MPPEIHKQAAQPQSTSDTAAQPKSLSLLAREEFGDAYHGDVEEAPKPKPEPQNGRPDFTETPEIPDEDVEEGGENQQVEGDEVDDAAPTPEAAEETAEPIATVRELVEHLDADPAWFEGLKVDVMVNGNPSQVPLKDVIESFRTNQAADERLEQAKSKSQQAQQEIAERNAALDVQYEQAARLVLMQEQQLTADMAAINWDQLKQDDPALWSAERVRFGERQQQIQQARQQTLGSYQQLLTQRQQEHQSRKATIQNEQSQLLMEAMPKISPDWGDPQKSSQAKGRLATYLVGQGFAPKEIEDTLDHRAFVVAEKARLWDESQSKLQITKKRIQTVPKVMKPGAGKEPSTVSLEKVRNAQKQLRQTGRMDDALTLLRAKQNRR